MGFNLKQIISTSSDIVEELGKHVEKNKDLQKILFGTYSNGKPRNLTDAIAGEIIHPEDKLAITKRLEKHDKKKKKKKSKGKKYAKIDISKLAFNDDECDE